jgi:hypothetical protein
MIDISSGESRRGGRSSLLRTLGSSRRFSSTPNFSPPSLNIHHFYFLQNMPYVVEGNNFKCTHSSGFVHRRPSSGRLAGGPVPPVDYPSLGEMVAWAQSEDGGRVASDERYVRSSFDDRLFMLSCLGVVSEDRRKGRGGHGDTSVLRDLFRMGQLDWDEYQKPSPANTRSFRYTAALGQELLRRIERSEDRVYLF